MTVLTLHFLLAFTALVSSTVDVMSLREFIAANRDAKLADLEAQTPPVANGAVEFDVKQAAFKECISLTPNEEQILSEHGVMITQRQSWNSFFEAYLDLFQNDQPVYVTAASILHSVQKSYVAIVSHTETNTLIRLLTTALNELQLALAKLPQNTATADLVDFLSVPQLLLAPSGREVAASAVAKELAAACEKAEGTKDVTIFGRLRTVDFSQCTPRGHYTSSDSLKSYFRAMMWLGRTVIALDENLGELRAAYTLASLVVEVPAILEFERVLQVLIGVSDNAKAAELVHAAGEVGIKSLAAIDDDAVLTKFQEHIKKARIGEQAILSEIIAAESPGEDVTKPLAYKLLGQRYSIDSDTLGMSVWQGAHSDPQPWKMLPETTDILYAALGNNDALQVAPLRDIDALPLAAGRLASARRTADAYFGDKDSGTNSTLYGTWLGAQRQLSANVGQRNSRSQLKQSLGFQLHMMATQLMSYTQLRHANVLYVKESYTPAVGCHFPSGYVEPVPEVFAMLGEYARVGSSTLVPLIDHHQAEAYFAKLGEVSKRLEAMAHKATQTTPLDADDMMFLNQMVVRETVDLVCARGVENSGWFKELYINDGDEVLKDEITVGIHTTPQDQGGTTAGWVKHLGTGKVHPVVIVADGCTEEGGVPSIHIGVTQMPHELTTNDFERLTDEQWTATELAKSDVPEWLNPILAGPMATGEEKLYSSKCVPDTSKPYSAAVGGVTVTIATMLVACLSLM